jgi:hypothetical protein
MVNTGISWQSDKSLYGPTKYTIGATREESAVEVPPNWQLRYPKGYTTDTPPPNLVDDEPFQVWMRSAGLPTFSKLAQRNDTQVLGTGTYRVDIQYSKPRSLYVPPLASDPAQTFPCWSTAAQSRLCSRRAPSWAARTPFWASPTSLSAASASCSASSSRSRIWSGPASSATTPTSAGTTRVRQPRLRP